MRRMPYLLIISSMVALLGGVVGDCSDAFMRTTVRCPAPQPDPLAEDACPTGSTFVAPDACEAVPPHNGGWSLVHSSQWSGSAHCADQEVVLTRGAEMKGTLVGAAGFAAILASFCGGVLSDTLGRKAVMVIARVFASFSDGLSLVASRMPDQVITFLMAGHAIGAFAGMYDAGALTMVADMSENDEVSRSTAYAAYQMVTIFASFVGMVGGTFVLNLELDDYSLVYAIDLLSSILIVIAAICLLRETLPVQGPKEHAIGQSDSDGSSGDESSSDSASGERRGCCDVAPAPVKTAVHTIWQDAFLVHFLAIHFVFSIGFGAQSLIRPLMMAQFGYSAATASLIAVVVPIGLMAGAAACKPLSHMVGAYAMYAAGLALITVSYFGLGISMLLTSFEQVIFWALVLLAGAGAGMLITSEAVITSLRVPPDSLGTVRSVLAVVFILGGMIGEALSSEYLFDASATGLKAGLPFYCSGFSILFSAVWFSVSYKRCGKRVSSLRVESGYP